MIFWCTWQNHTCCNHRDRGLCKKISSCVNFFLKTMRFLAKFCVEIYNSLIHLISSHTPSWILNFFTFSQNSHKICDLSVQNFRSWKSTRVNFLTTFMSTKLQARGKNAQCTGSIKKYWLVSSKKRTSSFVFWMVYILSRAILTFFLPSVHFIFNNPLISYKIMDIFYLE